MFGIKQINNFDPYNVFLAIATNIPQRLKVLWSRVTCMYVYIYIKYTHTYMQNFFN